MDSWIHAMVRNSCRRRLIAWGLVVAAVLAGLVGSQRYIYNFLSGPFAIDAPELARIADVTAAPKYFVTVSGSETLDTGLQEITIQKRSGRETGRSVSATYYALVMGDRLLLVKSSTGLQKTIVGSLEPLPADVASRLFDTVEMQAIRPRFYPFYVNDASFRAAGYVSIAIGAVVAFLLLRSAVPAWKRFKDVSSHPVMQRVNAWEDPLGAAVAAEREFRAPAHKVGHWRIGEQFLTQSSLFSFDILRLSDLLWAYKAVTKHRVNFIPAGKTYQTVLVCYGGTAQIQCAEKTCDELIAHAAQRTPWAVFGYSDELMAMFTNQNQDFCAAVEGRRQQWLAGA